MYKMASKDILAINLKYCRYQYNLSQEKFAEFLGSTLPYINQLENKRRKPTLELLDEFSQKLNITSADLITFNEKHYIIAKRIDKKNSGVKSTILKIILKKLRRILFQETLLVYL